MSVVSSKRPVSGRGPISKKIAKVMLSVALIANLAGIAKASLLDDANYVGYFCFINFPGDPIGMSDCIDNWCGQGRTPQQTADCKDIARAKVARMLDAAAASN